MKTNKYIEEFREKFVTNVFGFPKAEELEQWLTKALKSSYQAGRDEAIEEIKEALSVINGIDEFVPLDSVMFEIDKAISKLSSQEPKSGKEGK